MLGREPSVQSIVSKFLVPQLTRERETEKKMKKKQQERRFATYD